VGKIDIGLASDCTSKGLRNSPLFLHIYNP